MLDSLRESVGRYAAPIMVAGKLLLSSQAEAAPMPYVEVKTDQFLARCATTEDGVWDRNDADHLAEVFGRELNEALEDPSDRKLERAVEYAMWARITKQTGNPQKDLITPGELDARLAAVLATRQSDLRDTTAPAKNRKILLDARKETAEDAAILSLVTDADGKLLSGEELLAKFPEFRDVYRFENAMEFVQWFKETYKRDCEKAVRYTLSRGYFPAVDLISDIRKEPEVVISATYKSVPDLRPDQYWRRELGYEDQEFWQTLPQVEAQQEGAKHLDRLRPWLYMGPEDMEPKIYLTPEELVVDSR